MSAAGSENVAKKFEAAWEVFSLTCAGAVAPEATFQAWFAHYLISQFGIDRVVREADFGIREPGAGFVSPMAEHFKGGAVYLDAVVLRRPGVDLPFRTATPDGTGADRLADFAVISELKVASSAWAAGLNMFRVCQDFFKLSMLLDEARHRGLRRPLAYVCVLDNNPNHPFDIDAVHRRAAGGGADAAVRLLAHSTARRTESS